MLACSSGLGVVTVPHCLWERTQGTGRTGRRGSVRADRDRGVMGLITHDDGPARAGGPYHPGVGYETVPLLIPGAVGDAEGGQVAVLRRRSARRSKRAVVYVHCLGDAFVPADLVGWYTDRGFHFYAADLRAVGNGGPGAARGEPGSLAAGHVLRLPGCRRHPHARGRRHPDRGGVCARGRRPDRRAVVPCPAGQPPGGRPYPRQPGARRGPGVAGQGGRRAGGRCPPLAAAVGSAAQAAARARHHLPGAGHVPGRAGPPAGRQRRRAPPRGPRHPGRWPAAAAPPSGWASTSPG